MYNTVHFDVFEGSELGIKMGKTVHFSETFLCVIFGIKNGDMILNKIFI